MLTFNDVRNPSPEDLFKIYSGGYQGIIYDPISSLIARRVIPSFYTAYPELRGVGKGRVSLPYKAALALEPEFGKYEAQVVGDCVSHSTRNAGMLDYCMDVIFHGSTYQGRFATENIYGYRGHIGHGASCSRLAQYVSTNGPGGFLPRKKYSSGNNSVDLSMYTASIGTNWGRSGPPQWLNEIADDHKALRVTRLTSMDEAIDALASGMGISMCSGLGFSSTRNEDGLSENQGSWAHAMAWIGVDDSDYAHQKYDGPVFLVQNCYSKDTEILTKNGWKYFYDLSKQDEICTLNPNTHEIEYDYPSEIQEYDYHGYMWKYGWRGIDALVTPNHKMYAAKINTDTKDPKNWKLTEAQKLVGHHHFKKDGKWTGEEVEYKELGDKVINMDLWLEFLGHFLSDGYTTLKKVAKQYVRSDNSVGRTSQNHYIIGICAKRDRKVKKIQKLLNLFPLKFRKISGGWRKNNKSLYYELRKFGKAHEKFIPKEILELSVRQLKILYTALMAGDGSEQVCKNGSVKRTYYTSSKQLADDFQELCLKIGYASDIATIDRIGRDNGTGGITRYKEYHVRIKQTSLTPRNGKKGGLNPLLIPYQDKVYCCTVPNHIIYVRRNGKAMWCGQSWGKWNGGPRKYDQPEGSFFIRPSVASRMINGREGFIIAAVQGWNIDSKLKRLEYVENVSNGRL